jgi:hypothetical protein
MVADNFTGDGYKEAIRRRLAQVDDWGNDSTNSMQNYYAQQRSLEAQNRANSFNGTLGRLSQQQSQANYAGGQGGGSSSTYKFTGNGKGQNTFDNFVQAIIKKESGGRYGVKGVPVGSKGNRAYGAYQVMASNIPSWSKTVLGRSITPEQYLNSPKLQDQIAQHYLRNYYNKYGPAGAAVAWYAGEGTARKWVKSHGVGFNQEQRASGKAFPSISAYAYDILKKMGL